MLRVAEHRAADAPRRSGALDPLRRRVAAWRCKGRFLKIYYSILHRRCKGRRVEGGRWQASWRRRCGGPRTWSPPPCAPSLGWVLEWFVREAAQLLMCGRMVRTVLGTQVGMVLEAAGSRLGPGKANSADPRVPGLACAHEQVSLVW